jgi:5'-nucleotidase
MHVLVTNDDSHASPLLHFLVEYLQSRVTLTVVVPEHEQSWRGKAITRFEDLTIRKKEIVGFPVTTIDGTPADCANAGIHHICETPPDLVISGINAGQNTGTGFILSSGTVGACLDANIAGLPAIALSQHLDWSVLTDLKKGDVLQPDIAGRLRKQAETILDALLERLQGHETFLDRPVTLNVNFPFHLKEPVQFVPAQIGRNLYGSLFAKRDATTLYHDLRVITRDPRQHVDAQVIEEGNVSITEIDIHAFGQMTETTMRSLKEVWGRP